MEGDIIAVTIIPHTYRNTTLHTYRAGSRVNLECDIIAKYVERMLANVERPSALTEQKLRELGY